MAAFFVEGPLRSLSEDGASRHPPPARVRPLRVLLLQRLELRLPSPSTSRTAGSRPPMEEYAPETQADQQREREVPQRLAAEEQQHDDRDDLD